jgi:hypothetical protein
MANVNTAYININYTEERGTFLRLKLKENISRFLEKTPELLVFRRAFIFLERQRYQN